MHGVVQNEGLGAWPSLKREKEGRGIEGGKKRERRMDRRGRKKGREKRKKKEREGEKKAASRCARLTEIDVKR